MKRAITERQARRKRRRELLVALFAAVVVGIIFLVESRIARSAEEIPFAGHLLLFALLSIVTLLLILIIFFLFRNIFKLVFERRQGVLGANLKTRLTLAFVALTLVPTVVLFIASAGVLHTTIESWFKEQVEESLQSSLVVAQAYYQNASDNALNSSEGLASLIEKRALLDPNKRSMLWEVLKTWRERDGLSSVQIYFRDGSPPVLMRDEQLGDVAVPPPRPSFLKISFKGETTSKIIPLDGGSDLIRGISPVKSTSDGGVEAAVVADYYIPTSLAARLFSISNAFGDYQEARRMKGPVKTIYILILLMVALLVIFIGFWIGVSIAGDITDPLLKLSEATERIAGGDLEVYVEPVADDELGVLVKSFNEMAADLRTGRNELVRVNTDLENRRKYMETVLRNVAAGVLSIDENRSITTMNKSARSLLRISEEDIIGKPLSEVLPEVSYAALDDVLGDLNALNAEAVERQISLSFPEKVVALICFANNLRDEEGHNMGVVLVFEDMTQMVKTQRMAAWREVARRIAHEIKNPLTPIQLSAQRVRRQYLGKPGVDSEILDQCTRTIIDQVEQLKTMVNEFSQFARMPSANPVPNDLNALVREVVELYLQGNNGTRFSFEPATRVPIFDLDKEQMKRVLVNLIDNAAAAAGDTGTVEVRTAYDPILSIASVEVADNGPGIDPQDRERLFEPYFSKKLGGTGLGLTIVSTIVSDHNGFIRVKDNPLGGARFIIELPVKRG
ncbi:MAG: ATP-binding protein [Desulfomonilaceae bacterium]|nr:ATP-binding protein [Desulfomonilaceae bacterium]